MRARSSSIRRPGQSSERMSESGLVAAPQHPEIGRRSLIAWPGYRSGLVLASFDRRVVGAIAKPLAHAVLDQSLVSEALKAGMGVVLPAQAWRNQLPVDHPKRGGAFARLKVHRPGVQLVADGDPLRAAFAERYAADHLAAEIEGGATILTTPGHVLETEGRAGRKNDLLLARLAATEFADRRAWAAAAGEIGRRELYATIIVQGRHAAVPGVIDWLVAAYAELDGVTGYWIIAANTSQSGRQLAGYARLALRLQRLTGRPAAVSCVGDGHLAMLASGVAATCAGLHGMSFRHPPAELPERDDEETGLGVHTYHPAVLGNAGPLGATGEAIRRALFLNRPCPCGHHPEAEPPVGTKQIVAHNCWAVGTDAREFALPDVAAAEIRLATRAGQAARERAILKMSKLRTGFDTIPREATRLRDADADVATDERNSAGQLKRLQGRPLAHGAALQNCGSLPTKRGRQKHRIEARRPAIRTDPLSQTHRQCNESR